MATIPTAQEIRDFLEGYCSLDNLITDSWIEARRDNFVVKWIESKFGFSILQENTIEEYYDGTGTNILFLNHRLANELVEVEYVVSGDNRVTLELTTFILVPNEGIIKAIRTESVLSSHTPAFPKGKKNIRIRYKTGFATDQMPEEVKEAIIYFTAEKTLALLADRTGGGTTSSCGKQYGSRGKYTDIRNELGRMGYAAINDYFSGVVGS
jgi:hypothetical protein